MKNQRKFKKTLLKGSYPYVSVAGANIHFELYLEVWYEASETKAAVVALATESVRAWAREDVPEGSKVVQSEGVWSEAPAPVDDKGLPPQAEIPFVIDEMEEIT